MNTDHAGRNILLALLALLLLTGAFSGGLIVGWLIPSTSAQETLVQNTQTATQQTDVTQSPDSLGTLFDPFREAWQIVHDQYVDQPVDDQKLMQGAIRGMLDALGDKHSGYMDPEEYYQATMPLDGSYTGIGAWVDTTGDFLTIISPMEGSPAERAGIKAGDEIIEVDGKDITGVDPSIVLQSVLGPSGTDVKLKIQRKDPAETLEFTITREKITLPSIESEMLDDNIGYIALTTFGDSTAVDLEKALKTLLDKEPVGLILDLRNNTGGYLDTAIEVISQFIPEGKVMIEQLGTGEELTYDALPGGIATEIPLVILVNEGSASASEITAGAIQDFQRGKLVGTVTYGKGSVQNWVPLKDNKGAVRITIARWLTPAGRQIHGVGLTPDYIVEITEEDAAADRDPQLQKAIDLLLNRQ